MVSTQHLFEFALAADAALNLIIIAEVATLVTVVYTTFRALVDSVNFFLRPLADLTNR